MEERIIYKFFTDDDLLRISKMISKMEKSTSGEIRISIKEKKNFQQRKASLRNLAEDEFFRLGMANTRDKTGILLFILLKEKQFYILADSGINEKVEEDTWENIKEIIQNYFFKGLFTDGILKGIELIGQTLSTYFPVKQDDTNELSNRVIIQN